MDIDPEEFDFTAVSVTKAEYYDLLDTFRDHPAVTDVYHSLPLNEMRLIVAPDADTGDLSDLWPADLTIRQIGYTDTGEIEVDLRTTRYLAPREEYDELFPGEYTDEAMTYCCAQLSLFDEVAAADLVRGGDGRLHVRVQLTDDFETSHVFNELQTLLGYTITAATVTDGQVQQLLFRFDETRPFSEDAQTMFKQSKLRTIRNAAFDTSDPVPAPCGHDADPQLLTFRHARDDLFDAFPTTDVNGFTCYEIPVTDDAVFLTVTNWPDGVAPVKPDDGSVPVSFARGYRCEDCDVAYRPVNERSIHAQTAAADVTLDSAAVEVRLPDAEAAHTFTIIDEPLLPVEYR